MVLACPVGLPVSNRGRLGVPKVVGVPCSYFLSNPWPIPCELPLAIFSGRGAAAGVLIGLPRTL